MEDAIDRILNLARWAPSGDNEQPWRFEKVSADHFTVHGHDTRDWCVYDLDGRASQIALGALMQTIEIAASSEGLDVTITRRESVPATKPVFDVHLTDPDGKNPSELLPFIEKRVTQRRPMSTRPLDTEEKQALENSLGEGYEVIWLEGRKNRWQMAKLLFKSAHIRLTTPEAYQVHRKNIEWNARFSESKIPDQAIGVDRLTLKMMRWVLKSWGRVTFMNRYFLGTWLPRLQMDLFPGLKCAAHFLLLSTRPLGNIDDYVEGGKAVQRFWLTAASLGLQFQPEMTPLIFSKYSLEHVTFSEDSRALARAHSICKQVTSYFLVNDLLGRGVFMGRIGRGKTPKARSIRKKLAELMLSRPSSEMQLNRPKVR